MLHGWMASKKNSNYTDDGFLQPSLDKYSHSHIQAWWHAARKQLFIVYKCNHNFMADKSSNNTKEQKIHELYKVSLRCTRNAKKKSN